MGQLRFLQRDVPAGKGNMGIGILKNSGSELGFDGLGLSTRAKGAWAIDLAGEIEIASSAGPFELLTCSEDVVSSSLEPLSDFKGPVLSSLKSSLDHRTLSTASVDTDAVSKADDSSTRVIALAVPVVGKSARSEQGSRTAGLGTASSGLESLAFIEYSLEVPVPAAAELCPERVVEIFICCSMSSSETPESSQTLPDATISCSKGVCENPPDVFAY